MWSSDNGADPNYRFPADRPGPRWAGSGRASPARGAVATSPRWRAPTAPRASSAGRARCPRARSATSWSTWSTCSPPWRKVAGAEVPDRPADRRHGHGRLPARRRARSPGATRCCACRATGCRPSSGASGRRTCSKQDDMFVDLVALQHAAPAQPRVGPAGGARGRLPARLGDAPDGRRRRRVPQDPGHGAPDQAGHTRPLHPARHRASGGPRRTSRSGRSPSSTRCWSSPTTNRNSPPTGSSTSPGRAIVSDRHARTPTRERQHPRVQARRTWASWSAGWCSSASTRSCSPGASARSSRARTVTCASTTAGPPWSPSTPPSASSR